MVPEVGRERAAFFPAAGQRLAAQHPVAHFNAQFALGANVLLSTDRQSAAAGNLTQRGAVRLGFHFRR